MEAPAGCGLGGAMFKLPGMLEGLLRRCGAELPRGAEDEISLIKRDLEEIITILKGRSNLERLEDGRFTTVFSCWTKEVRELSYDMEDFIDEYEHVRSLSPTPRRNSLVTRRRRGRSKTIPPYWLREQLRQRLWMANKIREFSVRAQEALERHAMYNLGPIASDVSGARASSSSCHPAPFLHDELLVGIDASMDKLEEWLTMTHGEEHQKLRVVSVVGPGGVGKTSLANELYRKLGQHFECRAFVRATQNSDVRKLFVSMISQLGVQQTPNDWNAHSLIASIRSHLQYKRYLIIIDELWCTSKWDIIKCALPNDNSCSSRILIMTEVEDIALHSCGYDSTYVLKLKPLGEDESQKLFFCSIFGPQGECPPELREVSYQIIRKCGGLPLAIVMVASLLVYQKQTQERWNHVNKYLGYSLVTNYSSEGMKQILSLSYNNLPEHLKGCMLYTSIYQEDNIIWKDDLVNQWTAEGFIWASRGQDEQEIAASYFDELVSRKIIQPVDIKDDGEVLSCMVHHMVLNHIAAHKAVEENFVTAIHNSQTTTIHADKIRRLSLHFGDAEDAIQPSNMRLSQVRTIAFFGVFKCIPSIVEFRLLQVLILYFWGDKDSISLDLTSISELFRLRYLKVSSNTTLELKTQMQGLKKLETIKIDAKVTVIPSEINQLTGLLHLSLPAETDLPNGICCIASLRTLRNFDIASNSIENIRSLSKLSNLQDLQLIWSSDQPGYVKKIDFLLTSILERLRNLKSLTLLPTASFASVFSGITVSNDDTRFNNLTLLQRFEFSPHICIFYCLPKCIELTKLAILKIGLWEMDNNCVDVLKGLPALAVLSLYVHCKPAETIVIGKEGFHALKCFMFKCSKPMLKFNADAVPNLRKLMLSFDDQRADQQVTVPFGMEHLSGLKEVYAEVGCDSYEEPNRRAIELAFRDAMRVHGRCCRVIVTCVNKIFCSMEDQSSVPQKEEETALKWLEMEEISNEHDQSMKYVEHVDSRFIFSEWNMLLLLRNKIDNQNDDITSGIPVIDPYLMDPWKLADIGIGTEESRFYFRPLHEANDGSAPSGYWRETGSTGYVYSAKKLRIGKKRTMEFYQGNGGLGKRTMWRMKEFIALQESSAGAMGTRLMGRVEMSLCQLYVEQDREGSVADKSASLGISTSLTIGSSLLGAPQLEPPRTILPGSIASFSVAENYRKRKSTSIKRTVVTTNLDDGFSWRKYGQKEVANMKHPRVYFRCEHRHRKGCIATKQVQRTDHDSSLFDVSYLGEHTCREDQTEHSVDESSLSVAGSIRTTESSNSPQLSESQGLFPDLDLNLNLPPSWSPTPD